MELNRDREASLSILKAMMSVCRKTPTWKSNCLSVFVLGVIYPFRVWDLEKNGEFIPVGGRRRPLVCPGCLGLK